MSLWAFLLRHCPAEIEFFLLSCPGPPVLASCASWTPNAYTWPDGLRALKLDLRMAGRSSPSLPLSPAPLVTGRDRGTLPGGRGADSQAAFIAGRRREGSACELGVSHRSASVPKYEAETLTVRTGTRSRHGASGHCPVSTFSRQRSSLSSEASSPTEAEGVPARSLEAWGRRHPFASPWGARTKRRDTPQPPVPHASQRPRRALPRNTPVVVSFEPPRNLKC